MSLFEEFDKEYVKAPIPVSRILREFPITWEGEDGLMDLILRLNPNQLIPSNNSVVSFDDYETICACLAQDGYQKRKSK